MYSYMFNRSQARFKHLRHRPHPLVCPALGAVGNIVPPTVDHHPIHCLPMHLARDEVGASLRSINSIGESGASFIRASSRSSSRMESVLPHPMQRVARRRVYITVRSFITCTTFVYATKVVINE